MPFRTFPEPYAYSPHRIFKTSELHRAVHRLQHAGKHYVPMRTHTCTIIGHYDFTTRAKACKYIEPGNAENKKSRTVIVRDLIICKAFVLLNENLVLAYYVNTLLQALGCLNSLNILLNEHTVGGVNVNDCFL